MELMESAPTSIEAPIGAANGVPHQAIPGVVDLGAGAAGASSEEQKRKWREKGRLARQRRKSAKSGVAGMAGAGEEIPRSPQAESAPGAGGVSAAPIPWDRERLKRLWAQLVPTAERWDIGKLKLKAQAVDESLVALVETEGKWNDLSKVTLVETGPNVTADFLESIGIGAEKSDLVAFTMACMAIYSGRAVVAEKLETMLAEKKEREREQSQKRRPAAEPTESE